MKTALVNYFSKAKVELLFHWEQIKFHTAQNIIVALVGLVFICLVWAFITNVFYQNVHMDLLSCFDINADRQAIDNYCNLLFEQFYAAWLGILIFFIGLILFGLLWYFVYIIMLIIVDLLILPRDGLPYADHSRYINIHKIVKRKYLNWFVLFVVPPLLIVMNIMSEYIWSDRAGHLWDSLLWKLILVLAILTFFAKYFHYYLIVKNKQNRCKYFINSILPTTYFVKNLPIVIGVIIWLGVFVQIGIPRYYQELVNIDKGLTYLYKLDERGYRLAYYDILEKLDKKTKFKSSFQKLREPNKYSSALISVMISKKYHDAVYDELKNKKILTSFGVQLLFVISLIVVLDMYASILFAVFVLNSRFNWIRLFGLTFIEGVSFAFLFQIVVNLIYYREWPSVMGALTTLIISIVLAMTFQVRKFNDTNRMG